MGGTRNKVEGGDRHDLEPGGMRKDTGHKIYTGSSCLGDQVWRPALGVGLSRCPARYPALLYIVQGAGS
jgi:hypothetical protein